MCTNVSSLRPGVVVHSTCVRVSVSAPTSRLSLRARGESLTALGSVLGLKMPERIGQRSSCGTVEIIQLGPDEWTLIAPVDEAERLISACAAIYIDRPHSLVDISGREVTLLIEGQNAEELLTIGCARSIESIPIGEGRRTAFDGVTVILWRDAVDSFRLDVWNSFAAYVVQLLTAGSKELITESN